MILVERFSDQAGTPSDTAADMAGAHLLSLQHGDGRWEGEMAWNTMLLSQYVLTRHMVKAPSLSAPIVVAVRRHFEVTRLPDGSWPAHSDSGGSVYVTTLAYVALRVLGTPPDHPLISVTPRWLARQPGGVAAIPTWGRMWLAMLGLYDYEGINPIPPELILLPRVFPLHPNQLYCHTRYVYAGLAYLYGRRARFDVDGSLLASLRVELYGGDYDHVDFAAARELVRGPDVLAPPGRALRRLYRLLFAYERHRSEALRKAALRRCAALLRYELEASRGHGLSPVNGLLACLVLALEGDPRAELTRVLRDIRAWVWQDDIEGMRVAGARSSAWDTSFAIRALLTAHGSVAVVSAVSRAYQWLSGAQETDELRGPSRAGRDGVRGGWCVSDGTHRWPVSDCTAEALSCVLLTHDRPDLVAALAQRVPDERIFAAVEFIITRQNADGGFGTYERRRAPEWVIRLNPSEMYLDCMTDRSHVECSASCIAALARFTARYPDYDKNRITSVIDRGINFLRARQRRDGSYPAAWGIYFTYSAFFVVEAMLAAGVSRSDPAVAHLVQWLIEHQKPDGGWGEHYDSCLTGTYAEHPESQATMTAWALLALTGAHGPHEVIQRGRKLLTKLQQQSGGWPRQASSGVFFGSAVLDYRLYRHVFPTWALLKSAQPRRGVARRPPFS